MKREWIWWHHLPIGIFILYREGWIVIIPRDSNFKHVGHVTYLRPIIISCSPHKAVRVMETTKTNPVVLQSHIDVWITKIWFRVRMLWMTISRSDTFRILIQVVIDWRYGSKYFNACQQTKKHHQSWRLVTFYI